MKTPPMPHQVDGLAAADKKRNFAFFAEQGTGKTWMTLADGERCYEQDKIEAILVIAPKGVHINWIKREIPTHLSVPTICYTWRGAPSSKKAHKELADFFEPWRLNTKRPLMVMAINIDGCKTEAGYNACVEFLNTFECMIVVDESSRIKNPTSVRTKKVTALGRMAKARRILSGTPMPKAPSDLYSQFHFLKPGLLGTDSYFTFMSEYACLLDRDDPEMIAIIQNMARPPKKTPQIVKKDELGRPMFKNLERLHKMMAPHCFRVRKMDVLKDLPPKVYKPIFFELSAKQRAVYRELEDEYKFLFEDSDSGIVEDMSFQAIAARTKMKQVTSGFINIYGEAVLMAPEDNPRMAAFKDLVDTLDEIAEGPVIVWAMYSEELKQVKEYLDKKGKTSAIYDGGTPDKERERIIDEFQAGNIEYFLGQPAAAGIGLTLTRSSDTIYYSVGYDNELRLQSEDRNHRIGTAKTVTYYDLIGEETIDEAIMRSLDSKNAMASIVVDGKY